MKDEKTFSRFYISFTNLCKAHNLSPTAAAKAAGISSGAPTAWKNSGSVPKPAQREKLCNLFGVTDEQLLGYGPEESADAVINDISQYQAIISWTVAQDDVPDRVKDVIQSELPENTMAPLAALSYQTGVHFNSSAKEKPTPVSGSGQPVNIVKIAGRDGSFVEKHLSDKELQALKAFVELLPDAEDL